MDDNFHSLEGNNVFSLRNNLEKQLLKTDMRKKLIGGISEEDVNIYIANIRIQFQQVENELKQYIKDLQFSKDELHNEFENDRKKLTEEKLGLQEALNEALLKSADYLEVCNEKEEIIINMENKFNSEIKELYEENQQLRSKLDDISKTNEELKYKIENGKNANSETQQKIEMLNKQIAELEESLEQGRNKSVEEQDLREKAEQQIKDMNSQITKYEEINNIYELKVNDLEKRLLDNLAIEEKYSKALNFKNELEAIYSMLDGLKEKAESHDYIQQQLVNERFRADNAEKDMTRLLEWITGLKDKYKKEE